ncbi:UDP-N-acetylmuramoyl-L-alanine--D-glutamate ligase [Desulfonatronovibrio hydrogenovorans]|uniref:UDP-N-acetylmuramoyl-L-alanine--D-glutamate ligase n=1 Tax=Desulfonatronovibrio hydrogenovorans TaxID=53245 RepID=UPI000A00910E|nr:UDP-N-acetylmuramoyl-L-alanine--D-glutamate ligase [Desulfonatronovibrio hydrogenovorans]
MKELIHNQQLKGHRVVVVGAGRSGLAAASLLTALGAEVLVLEKNEQFKVESLAQDLVKAEVRLGLHSRKDFAGADLIVVSPGIPLQEIRALAPAGVMVCSELELASWFVHEPIIAVTGTNGKTTTTMVIAHALEKMGKKVFAGGNLGTPLSAYVLGRDECQVLVLEVSSFQLEGCSGFGPQVAVFLNFSPNHLDHHKDSLEYFQAKVRIFARQRDQDLAIIALGLREEVEKTGLVQSKRVYFAPSSRFACPALTGQHNQANLEAAFLACRYFGMDQDTFNSALNDFQPPAHRQEVFLKHGGRIFVNDSKATTTAAVEAALQAFEPPIRLFAGGIYKGGNFSDLSSLVQEKVKKAYLFGDSREIFESAWQGKTMLEHFTGLEQAVQKALSESEPGDTILLAPGTASFDLFSNYQERGNVFKELIKKNLGLPWEEKARADCSCPGKQLMDKAGH